MNGPQPALEEEEKGNPQSLISMSFSSLRWVIGEGGFPQSD